MLVQKWGIPFYIVLLSVHLYAQMLDVYTLQMVTKLLLIPSLMIYLAFQEYVQNPPYERYFIFLALVGSFLGDAFLLSEQYFIHGMIAFVSTHFFNILFFNRLHRVRRVKSKSFMILLGLFALLVSFILLDLGVKIGNLFYPIVAYMFFICLAGLMAMHTASNHRVQAISYNFWVPGMIFFIASDAFLAYNKFSWHNQNVNLLVMFTYGVAQLLLVKGFQLYLTQKPIETA